MPKNDKEDYDKIQEKIQQLIKYRKILEPIFSKKNFEPKKVISDKLKDILSEELPKVPEKKLDDIIQRVQKEILGVI